MKAYGSPQVKALMDEYFALIRQILEADKTIARALEDERDNAGRLRVRSGHVADYMQTRTDLNNRLRPAERIRREKRATRIALTVALAGAVEPGAVTEVLVTLLVDGDSSSEPGEGAHSVGHEPDPGAEGVPVEDRAMSFATPWR